MRPPVEDTAAETDLIEADEQRARTLFVGNAVIRVVGRCEDAKENNSLDLSDCLLIQVPDAVYHLMRNTELKSCDLSGNTITKIPPKFIVKFSLITELNISHNQMAKLPDELCTLANLSRLDISHNTFVALPHMLPKLPSLQIVLANNNSIIEIDIGRLETSKSLEEIDLQYNPIPPIAYNRLKELNRPKVLLSAREKEDWEDLEI